MKVEVDIILQYYPCEFILIQLPDNNQVKVFQGSVIYEDLKKMIQKDGKSNS